MPPHPGIDAASERSDLVRSAVALAREAHDDQARNTGSGEIPFVDHPMAVAERLAEHGFGDEVLAAALLHDVVEHTELAPDEVRERFGETVAGLVEALTEDESIEAYEERKEEHRERVAAAGPEARAIFAADKMANVEVLRGAYSREGEDVDEGLAVPLDVKIYIWELDLEMLFDEEPELPLVNQLADQLAGLWGERAAVARASLG